MFKSFEFPLGFLDLTKGHLVSQVIGMICSIVIAKIYGPGLLGVFSVYLTTTAILSTINTFRLESVLFLSPKSTEKTNNTLGILLIVLVVTFVFATLTLLISERFLKEFFVSKNVVFLAILSAFVKSITVIFQNLAILSESFRVIKTSKILFTISRYSFQLLFFIFSIHYLGLIVGYLLALLILMIYLLAKINLGVVKFSLNQFKKSIFKFYDIILYAFPGDLINSVATNVFPILLMSIYGDKITGNYFMAFLILTIPLSYLQAVVSPVFFKKSSEFALESRYKDLLKYTTTIVKRIFFLISIPVVLMIFIGEETIVFFFKEKWRDTGRFLEIFSILFSIRVLYSPIACLEEVLKKNKISLLVNIYFVFVLFASIYLGKDVLSVYQIAKCISVFMASGYLFLLIYFLFKLNKKSKTS